MKKLFLLFIWILIDGLANCQVNSTYNVFSTKAYGPFKFATYDTTNITVKIDRVKLAGNYPFRESDIAVRVVDSKGQVLYRINFPSEGYGSCDISIKEKYYPYLGNILMFLYRDEPSYPLDETSLQLFGFNSLNQFIPLTGLIRVGEYCDTCSTYGNLNWFFKDSIYSHPVTKLREEDAYLGITSSLFFHGFNVYEYYPIHKEGIYYGSDYRAKNITNIPISGSKFYTIDNIEKRFGDNPIISVYSKPDSLAAQKRVTIVKNKVVKFLNVLKIQSNENISYWVHLRINGSEGYIIISDMEKLGFSIE